MKGKKGVSTHWVHPLLAGYGRRGKIWVNKYVPPGKGFQHQFTSKNTPYYV